LCPQGAHTAVEAAGVMVAAMAVEMGTATEAVARGLETTAAGMPAQVRAVPTAWAVGKVVAERVAVEREVVTAVVMGLAVKEEEKAGVVMVAEPGAMEEAMVVEEKVGGLVVERVELAVVARGATRPWPPCIPYSGPENSSTPLIA